jgi:tetratricopeptide (TPR) repeat protein
MDLTAVLKSTWQLIRQTFCAPAGMLIMGLAIALPSAAQRTEQPDSTRCDQTRSLAEYQEAVHDHPNSSLANYCLAGLLFGQHSYQASANAYRSALQGDGYPSWTKVWSYIQLGKIFDVTDQRERALKQYQLAVQTGDNTRGAVYVALDLQQKPYESPKNR